MYTTDFFLFAWLNLHDVLLRKSEIFFDIDFSSHFSHLKTWNFTSGGVQNGARRETGDSWVVMSCDILWRQYQNGNFPSFAQLPSLFLCQFGFVSCTNVIVTFLFSRNAIKKSVHYLALCNMSLETQSNNRPNKTDSMSKHENHNTEVKPSRCR